MVVGKIANSHNDEYYTPAYAIKPILCYIPNNAKVWCPFDTDESLFVKMLAAHGCRVVRSHIAEGQDFFSVPVPECDFIVSNPPYSCKTRIFKRLFEIGKPFAMLVGSVGLFDCKERFDLFSQNEFEILWLGGRVAYFKNYSDKVPSVNPPYQSVYICSGILPNRICFAPIDKKHNVM